MYNGETYWSLIDKKKHLELNLVDVGLHSKGISEYLGDANTAKWFHISWSIDEVIYDGINYDAGFMMCEPAREYEIENQKLYERLIAEITLFTYLYSGFESYISDLDLTRCPNNNGKINAATFFISENLNENNFFIAFYSDILTLTAEMYNSIFVDRFDPLSNENKNCCNLYGQGIRLLYKVRNKLMHGDFFFPEPLDFGTTLPFHPELINLSSRLLLMSMQILIISNERVSIEDHATFINSVFLKNQNNPTNYCDEKEDCDVQDCDGCYYFTVNKLSFLNNLHIKSYNFTSLQCNINFPN